MDEEKIRGYFPILEKKIKGKPIIYLDSACMSLKPKPVIDSINEYYLEYTSCGERSSHAFGRETTKRMEKTRERVKKFFNAKNASEIVFTKNTTEGINLIAKSFPFQKNDIIISTGKEHNSNLVPWLQLAKEKQIKHNIMSTDNGFNLEEFESILKQQNCENIMVSIVHTSNMDGSSNPAKEIIKIAHENDALVMLDAAQSAPHKKIDVKKLDVDFISFSGHKMLGPTGTGILYGKEELLKKLNPFMTGGDTVKETTYTSVEYENLPEKFEAGLQNYANFIGLGEAIKYLGKYIEDIEEHEIKLNTIATEGLKEYVNILGPQNPKLRTGIFSFNAKNKMDFHEIALLLDETNNIMIRSGAHCVHSWFNAHNMKGSARASFYLYNTEDEAKHFVEKTKELLKMKK